MPFVFEKLTGLDRDKLLSAVDPVLAAHGFDGVELIWRTDNRGWVLYLTLEKPDTKEPGAGVTLDACSELSRDLSVALDVAEVISLAYRLEVGSPGVERSLYTQSEYERFSGQPVRVKLKEPINGEWTFRGTLQGLDELNRILLDTAGTEQDRGVFALEFGHIQTGQLTLDLGMAKHGPGKPGKGPSKKGPGKAKARRGSGKATSK
jgi:ribosome maturation factor RimP